MLQTPERNLSKSRIELAGFAIAYTGVLFAILPRLSLWLDEIRDLIGVRSPSFTAVLEYAARMTAAGVPLGYAVQFLFVRLFGFSTFTGRLPAALFSGAACLGLAALSRRLRIRHPLVPLLIFASFPLQFRYALEARPYSQGLCLSIWCTIAFLRLVDRPRFSSAALYCILIAAGLYTQPFSFFIPLAHLCWIILAGNVVERRKILAVACMAMAVAALTFLPWVIYAIEHWQKTAVSEGDHFTFTLKSPLMILKELVGAGYIGTVLTILATAAGLRFGRLDRDERLFWILYLAAPVAGAIAADAIFNYFLAIRQMIFVLAPLALLASLGIDGSKNAGARAPAVLCAALLAVNIVADIRFLQRSREDWRPASNRLSAEVARGACVLFVPDHTASIYTYFQPELQNHTCDAHDGFDTAASVAMAVSHYGSEQAYAEAALKVRSKGFTKAEEEAGEPRVEVYRRGAVIP